MSGWLTVCLEHAKDLGTSDGADLGDTVRVSQDHADLRIKKDAYGNIG